MQTWVLFTLLAALMQAVRTAGQKTLAKTISPMGSTLVRYVFGLPFVALYFFIITASDKHFFDISLPILTLSLNNQDFIIYALLASIAQIMATVSLVKVLSLRNFAIGTSFAKTEALQTAIFGVVIFSAHLNMQGWFAVAIGALGVIIISIPNAGQKLDQQSMSYGLLSGLGFAMTSLWIRQASLSLQIDFLHSAAMTLLFMVFVQSIICTLIIAFLEPKQFSLIQLKLPLALFVGITSALGSIGWFTAVTFENAALVKSLGQIEFIFTLSMTYWYFKEKVTIKEIVGMLAIISSVILLITY